jgi:hypothetical protein
MKRLSESLTDLAGRVEKLENEAEATKQEDRAELDKRREEIKTAIDNSVKQVEAAIHDATVAGRTWWNDLRATIAKQIDEIQERFERWQTDKELDRARHRADSAEEDAEAAIAVAKYCTALAEYAVVDAKLARMNAHDLEKASTGGNGTA